MGWFPTLGRHELRSRIRIRITFVGYLTWVIAIAIWIWVSKHRFFEWVVTYWVWVSKSRHFKWVFTIWVGFILSSCNWWFWSDYWVWIRTRVCVISLNWWLYILKWIKVARFTAYLSRLAPSPHNLQLIETALFWETVKSGNIKRFLCWVWDWAGWAFYFATKGVVFEYFVKIFLNSTFVLKGSIMVLFYRIFGLNQFLWLILDQRLWRAFDLNDVLYLFKLTFWLYLLLVIAIRSITLRGATVPRIY